MRLKFSDLFEGLAYSARCEALTGRGRARRLRRRHARRRRADAGGRARRLPALLAGARDRASGFQNRARSGYAARCVVLRFFSRWRWQCLVPAAGEGARRDRAADMILIQNALVLTPSGEGKPLDVVIDGGTIADVVPRGSVKGEGMERVDASGRALMPALVNGHNHAQTGLAKGRFDRHNLETYLNAQPGVERQAHAGGQAPLGADRRRRAGAQGLHRRLRHVRRVPAAERRGRRGGGARLLGRRHARGDRADDGRQELLRGDPRPRRGAARAAAQPGAEGEVRAVRGIACRRSGIWKSWKVDREHIKPALGPTIPHHCSDEFLVACRDLAKELGVGMQMHVAESKMQAIVGAEDLWRYAGLASRTTEAAQRKVLRGARRLAGRRRPQAPRRRRLLDLAQPGQQPEARLGHRRHARHARRAASTSPSAPTAPPPPTTSTPSRRCASRPTCRA